MVWYEIKTRLKFGAKKYICFEHKVPSKVLIKSGPNFSHFAWTVLKEMKQKEFCAQKGNIFSPNPNNYPFWMNFV